MSYSLPLLKLFVLISEVRISRKNYSFASSNWELFIFITNVNEVKDKIFNLQV